MINIYPINQNGAENMGVINFFANLFGILRIYTYLCKYKGDSNAYGCINLLN